MIRQNNLGLGVFGTENSLTMPMRDTVMAVHIFDKLKKIKRCLKLQMLVTKK